MATYQVSTAAQLTSTLSRATAGDTISLAAGEYGNVSIRNIKPSGTVTIQSADPDNPAHLNILQVNGAENLTFRHLEIGRALATGEAEFTQLTAVRNAANIVFDSVFIHGSLDGNAQNDGYGLLADNVNALTIIDSQFTQLTRGLVLSKITNLQVNDNRFDDMRTDGINVSGSKYVVLERNVFQGFYPTPSDHPDAIQIFNLGYAEPMTDVTIRNNVLLPGGTYGPQGIWISGGGEAGFRNFTIENNLMWSEGSYNGIGLYGLIGAKVSGNTMLSPTTDSKIFWIRVVDSSDIDLTGNLAEDFLIEASAFDIRLQDNVNLRTAPATRNQIVDINTPQSVSDLIVNGVGYQLPQAITADAPVSGAISSAFNGMLSGNTGSALSQILVNESSTADVNLSRLSEIVSQTPTVDATAFALPTAPYHAPEILHGMTMHQYLNGDWFTALP